jgi:nitrous oxide reductase accessory protein NosL
MGVRGLPRSMVTETVTPTDELTVEEAVTPKGVSICRSTRKPRRCTSIC